jgi:hypothetical protein
VFQHTRPEGAEESPGTGVLSSAPKSPSPRRGEKGKKNPDPFSSSAFHGFRIGPPCGRAAPPAATIRRPVGAETAYAGRNAEPRFDILAANSFHPPILHRRSRRRNWLCVPGLTHYGHQLLISQGLISFRG